MNITESTILFKALGDSSRLMIIDSLREKPQYVEELAERFNLAESTVSFHLKKLETAGLIKRVKEQYYFIFHLNSRMFSLTLDEITSFGDRIKAKEESRIEKYQIKVLKAFLKNGKIIRLPAQYKKRVIILENMLRLFSKNKIYAEKEIDNIISEMYDDYVTVRRLMIDEKMLMRENGLYTLNNSYDPLFSIADNTSAPVPVKQGKIKMDKNEIKRNYKQSPVPMGVYIIEMADDSVRYVGSSKNLNAILNRHRFELSVKVHPIPELQDSWNNSGEEKIKFRILDKLEPKEGQSDYNDDLQQLENIWIEKLRKDSFKVIRLKGDKPAREQ